MLEKVQIKLSFVIPVLDKILQSDLSLQDIDTVVIQNTVSEVNLPLDVGSSFPQYSVDKAMTLKILPSTIIAMDILGIVFALNIIVSVYPQNKRFKSN